MVFGKTRTFVFHKISTLWSSLRIKFQNLRFEDFHFFRVFVNISRTKKSSAEDFLFGNFYEVFEFFSKTFLFVLTFFSSKKNTKLKMAQNVRELARIFG